MKHITVKGKFKDMDVLNILRAFRDTYLPKVPVEASVHGTGLGNLLALTMVFFFREEQHLEDSN